MKTPAIVSCLLVLVHASLASAADLLVPSQYSTIQAAVNAAQNGDRVLVAPGTYANGASVSGKQIRIESVGGPSTTIIDIANYSSSAFSVSATGGLGVQLVGFTIKRCPTDAVTISQSVVGITNLRVLSGGRAISVAGSASSVNISSLQSAGMSGRDGSAIYATAGVVNCVMSQMGSCANVSSGGAVCVMGPATVVLQDCGVAGSSSTNGALYVSTGTLTMLRGSASSCVAQQGGLAYCASGQLTIDGVVASDLGANFGGAVYQAGGSVVVRNSRFGAIGASSSGAFVSLNGGVAAIEASVVENSTTSISGSRSGGYVSVGSASAVFTDCSFTNLGVQVQSSSTSYGGVVGVSGDGGVVKLERCDLRSVFRAGSFPGYLAGSLMSVAGSRDLQLVDCEVEDEVPNATDSLFSSGSMRVEPGASLTIVRGSYSGAAGSKLRLLEKQGTGAVTIDGSRFSRFSGGVIRVQGSCTLAVTGAVFTDNGALVQSENGTVVQSSDGAALVSIESSRFIAPNVAGRKSLVAPIPGFFMLGGNYFCRSQQEELYGGLFELAPNWFELGCVGDCDADGTPDSIVLAKGLDTDCNANGVPDSCDADSGSDCNNNGTPDACDLADGTAADCNLNGVPDSCEPDCDRDGTPDACEIAGGATDCDGNGEPDSCQADCDGDGVLDTCEIASGATDCDADGIPDACEIAAAQTLDFNNDGTLDACQPAMQFAGLQLEIQPIVGRGTDDLFPAGAVCYRLYARVSADAASAVGVYGNSQYPMVVSAAGGFWQSPFGGDLANEVGCNDTSALPSYRYDSWFTIGKDCALGNAVQNTGLDFTGFNSGSGINDADGLVFVAPGSPQAAGGAARRVLLAQFTTTRPVFPTGTVNVVGRSNGGSGPENGWLALGQQIPMPALVDCNGNGEHDAFDIAKGVALDCDQSGVPDTCEHPSAVTDCNSNGISDLCDCYSGFSSDINTNNVPDECECTGDIDANGVVDVDDIIWVLVSWGADGSSEADVNSDGIVNGADLAIVLQGWGQCS